MAETASAENGNATGNDELGAHIAIDENEMPQLRSESAKNDIGSPSSPRSPATTSSRPDNKTTEGSVDQVLNDSSRRSNCSSPRKDEEKATLSHFSAENVQGLSSPSCLFAKISQDCEHAETIAREWITSVQTDGPGAVSQVLSLVVDAACPSRTASVPLVSQEMIISNQPQSCVAGICQALANDAAEKKRLPKRLRKHLRMFWRGIVLASNDALLFDTDCFDTLLTWLEAFSRAPFRGLRISACIAAYALVDGFLEVGGRFRSELATYQRQLSTEQKKSLSNSNANRRSSRRGSAPRQTSASPFSSGTSGELQAADHSLTAKLSTRGKELAKKVDELSTKNTELGELTDKVFASIFVLKYRDVSSDIRVASVEALGSWILKYPEHFLDDTHNKYIGWLLFDKDAGVRRAALHALTELFKESSFVPNLQMFLRRFVARIVEMSNDKDIDVSICAVRLCRALLPSSILEQGENIEVLACHISSENSELRREAGAFVADFIRLKESSEDVGNKSLGKTLRKSKPKHRSFAGKISSRSVDGKSKLDCEIDLNTAKDDLQELIFIALSEPVESDVFENVVDAVWPHFPAIRHWKAYCELLLQHAEKGNTSPKFADELQDDDMVTLASLLLASSKKAKSNLDPNRTRAHLQTEQSGEELFETFMADVAPVMPKLLTSFRTEPRVLVPLAQLPLAFDPSLFSGTVLRPHYKRLLSVLSDMIHRFGDNKDIMRTAIGALRHLAQGSSAVCVEARDVLRKVAEKTAKQLRDSMQRLANEEEISLLESSVSRASILAEHVSCPADIAENALALLRARNANKSSSAAGSRRLSALSSSKTIGVDLCHLAAGLFMWTAARVLEACQGSALDRSVTEGALTGLISQREMFLRELFEVVRNGSESSTVRIAALKGCAALVAVSNGLHTRTRPDQAQVEQSDGKNATTDLCISSINAFTDEQELTHALIDCATIAAEDHIQMYDRGSFVSGKAAAMDNDADAQKHSDEFRDLLSSVAQLFLQNLLPRRVLHIPLLGFLMECESTTASVNSPSGIEVAKFCYNRYRQVLNSQQRKDIQLAVLRHAFAIDRKLTSDETSLSVQALTSCLLRETGPENVAQSALELIEIALSFCLTEVQQSDSTDLSRPDYSDTNSRIMFLIAMGIPLLPRITKESSSGVLEQFIACEELLDEIPHSKKLARDLRQLRQKLYETESGVLSKGKRNGLGKKRTRAPNIEDSDRQRPKARTYSRVQAEATSVRRSGRTKRVIYTEVGSDSENSSEDSLRDDETSSKDGDGDIAGTRTEELLYAGPSEAERLSDSGSSSNEFSRNSAQSPASPREETATDPKNKRTRTHPAFAHISPTRPPRSLPRLKGAAVSSAEKENRQEEAVTKVPPVRRSTRSRRW